MIVAVSTCKNEADIIGQTVRHLFGQGVDRVIVADAMSTDGTRDILAGLPVQVLDDREPYCYQSRVMTMLARLAYQAGAEWVVPFDADEFWCGTESTVADVLHGQPWDVSKVYARMWAYRNLEEREPDAKPLPKVAFRADPTVTVAMGNHDVDLPGGAAWGLEVCEVQFRSFEHFCLKVAQRLETLDPSLGAGEAAHYRQLAGLDVDGLRGVWDQMNERAHVYDPIPVDCHPDPESL